MTAIQTLTAGIAAGMNTNGWTFDQAYEVTVAAMIEQDRDAMAALAARL